VSQPTDLASALIAAEPDERERLLRGAEAGQLDTAISALGHRHETAAAEVLLDVDRVVDDRGLRKAARRELHRLRSAGVSMPALRQEPTPQPVAPTEPNVVLSQAWATDIDPTGSRALWLLGERRLGGAWLAALLLNDLKGLQDLSLVDTTRKRFVQELDERRRDPTGGTWVTLPGDYALRLVKESVDVTHEVGGVLPTRYRAFRDAFGEAPIAPERALVYETISPVEATFHPDWLEDSANLLREPELAGWHVDVPASLRERALEVARSPSTALLVPGNPPEQQALRLLADAAREALSPSLRRALRRRLEEVGYIFVTTDRLSAARLAVASARALDDSSVSLEHHPLLRMLFAGGLARLVQNDAVGGRRASDVLIELLERASDRQPGGATETRPSGLILPR
jgi:hypothetical protein